MVLVTLLWSIAGVVTRQLEASPGFEVTFWRSAFNALTLALLLAWTGREGLVIRLRQARWPVWLSGVCWAVMFTAFMFAITMTTVARVLLTLAATPLVTALAARLALGHRLPLRTTVAVGVAAAGIVWMFGEAAFGGSARDALGMAVALAVPLAAAVNWTLLQHTSRRGERTATAPADDMLPAVLIGACLSAAVMLPFAWPFQSTLHDIGWLALLGAVQLAIPCMLVLWVARVLPAPEIALIGLLEVLFGVLWAWWGAGEVPASSTLAGGALVIAALAANEALALASRR